MGRTAARVKTDEVVRLIKAAQSAGLTILEVAFDGTTVSLVTRDDRLLAKRAASDDLLAEPRL